MTVNPRSLRNFTKLKLKKRNPAKSGVFGSLAVDVFFEAETVVHDFMGGLRSANETNFVRFTRDAGNFFFAGRIAVDKAIIGKILV